MSTSLNNRNRSGEEIASGMGVEGEEEWLKVLIRCIEALPTDTSMCGIPWSVWYHLPLGLHDQCY